MDSLDLLAREDEFKKLNKQLEKKTESLMKEIEHAMRQRINTLWARVVDYGLLPLTERNPVSQQWDQYRLIICYSVSTTTQKQDIFSEFSPSLTLSPAHSVRKHSCDSHKPNTPPSLPPHHKPVQKKKKTPPNSSPDSTLSTKIENGTQHSNVGTMNSHEVETKSLNTCNCCTNMKVGRIGDDEEFLYAFVSVNVKDKVLPQSFLKDRPTIENVCKFLSSKVKLMQEQIDKLQGALDKKATQCDGHLRQLAELESERMTLLSKTNNMKASTADMKAKNMLLVAKLNEKERLYKEQRTETDRLTCELKRYRIKCNSAEAKSAAQQETIDNLRQQIDTVKRAEKEFRESSRSLSASHQTAISRLEAHIKVLNTRSDRQMALIDNLRRQNVLLNTEGAMKVLEKEYCDYLNQEF